MKNTEFSSSDNPEFLLGTSLGISLLFPSCTSGFDHSSQFCSFPPFRDCCLLCAPYIGNNAFLSLSRWQRRESVLSKFLRLHMYFQSTLPINKHLKKCMIPFPTSVIFNLHNIRIRWRMVGNFEAVDLDDLVGESEVSGVKGCACYQEERRKLCQEQV